MMKKILFSCMLFFIMAASFAYSQTYFNANMNAMQEKHNIIGDTLATGTGAFVLTNDGLWYYITVEGLSGPITAAHFHFGEMGVEGPPIKEITADFKGGYTARGLWSKTGSVNLTDSLIKALLEGKLYVNVHTQMNPVGEARGQVILASGTGMYASMDAWQERGTTAPTDTNAMGTASLTLTDAGLLYVITVHGLTGPIIASHFHIGAPGVSGTPVKDILKDFIGNTAIGVWSKNDTQALSDSMVQSLLLGQLYLNVHTPQHPNGEIRGQVLLNDGWTFTSKMDTAQISNVMNTQGGTGTGYYILTNSGLIYNMTIDALSGNITGAGFFQGPMGQTGSSVHNIFSQFNNNNAYGVWTTNDNEALSLNILKQLLTNNMYFNVSTQNNPQGEIRGQINLNNGTNFLVNLNSQQEINNSQSTGMGSGIFMVLDSGIAYSITNTGLTGKINNAGIFSGSYGREGLMLMPIINDFKNGNTANGFLGITDTSAIFSDFLTSLMLGQLYINIYTPGKSTGETRGQIVPAGGTPFRAIMSYLQEADSVKNGKARGTAIVTLTNEGIVYQVTVDSLSGSITGAHFHIGDPGVDGPIVKDITANFMTSIANTSNTAMGVWTKFDNTQPLTDSLKLALMSGRLYINVHTTLNPKGEDRGQLYLAGGMGFLADISGQQVVNPVQTGSNGTGFVSLTPAGIIYHVTVQGFNPPFTGIQIFNGLFGQNGTMVRNIFNDFKHRNTSTGVWFTTGADSLTINLINELMAGNLYFNVSSTAFPNGEIRGQIRTINLITDVNEPFVLNSDNLFNLQNYPNPAASTVMFTYQLTQPSNVELYITNSLGMEVSRLVNNQEQNSGSYNVEFNASGLSEGVYFCTLRAGSLSGTVKMIIVK